MADFELARESIEEMIDYAVLTTEFENNTEQRRLKHVNALIGWRIETPVLTYSQMTTYRNFIIGKLGSLSSFTFLNPFDNSSHVVRFIQGSFKTEFRQGHYKCHFEFKKVT